MAVATKMGKRGTVVIPAQLRRRYGLGEGALVTVDGRDDGVLIRPAVALPIESYSAQRKAEFLLSNAVDDADYEWACNRFGIWVSTRETLHTNGRPIR